MFGAWDEERDNLKNILFIFNVYNQICLDVIAIQPKHARTLGMGKMILFRELVLSVQFTITICLFDSFVLIRSLRQIMSFGVCRPPPARRPWA